MTSGKDARNRNRPEARRTIVVLSAGTLAAVVAFAGAALIRLADQTAIADELGAVAVIILLATPAVALITSAAELRRDQRTAAAMAVLVLVILAVATVVALLTR